MRTIEYRDVRDKSKWKRGPWDSEPDKVQWLDETTGLPCLIVRGPVGSLCGYVGVSPSHPFFGKDYDDVSADAHGGLTFAGGCMKDGQEASRVCHQVEAGEPDNVWWFGFDCAHSGDLCPGMSWFDGYFGRSDTYKDFDWVRAEVQQLAKQLRAAS
jgi:hypothetical protein